jgi:hypothetical protein
MAKKPGKQKAETWFEAQWNSHAFQGELPFDLALEFLGRRYTKRCKVVYAFTPGDWPFYDVKTKTIREALESAIYHVEIEAVPELRQKADFTWKLGKPYWLHFEDFCRDDVFSHDMREILLNAIEDKCRTEDAERRRIAAQSPASPARRTRARH